MHNLIAIMFGVNTTGSLTPNDVVIIGGGIHGASIAYYLMKRGVTCTIIEEVAVATAASGKAGGFLAKNWGDDTTGGLHELSYDLHMELAQELGLESYRQLSTMQVSKGRNKKKRGLDTEITVNWLDKNGTTTEVMDAHGTAQVCPLELATKLMQAAVAFGSTLMIARVCGIERDGARVTGVRYTTSVGGQEFQISASKIVIATGPWAGVHAEDWLGAHIPIQGVKSTSMVYKNCPDIILQEPYALFCDEDENECHLEIFPRNNGEIYVCGCGGSDTVGGNQLRPGGEAMNAAMIEPNTYRSHAAARSFSTISSLGDRWADVTQACLRPLTADGYPVMGALDAFGCEGAYISAGHNCWGILWAPISGQCMSEILQCGTCSILDLTPFRPERFS